MNIHINDMRDAARRARRQRAVLYTLRVFYMRYSGSDEERDNIYVFSMQVVRARCYERLTTFAASAMMIRDAIWRRARCALRVTLFYMSMTGHCMSVCARMRQSTMMASGDYAGARGEQITMLR